MARAGVGGAATGRMAGAGGGDKGTTGGAGHGGRIVGVETERNGSRRGTTGHRFESFWLRTTRGAERGLGIQRGPSGGSMGTQWGFNGDSTGTQRGFNGIQRRFNGDPTGIQRRLNGDTKNQRNH